MMHKRVSKEVDALPKTREHIPDFLRPFWAAGLKVRPEDDLAVAAKFVSSLGIRQDDVIVSVGGGGGASIQPESLVALLGAKLIIASKAYSTTITTDDVLDGLQFKHPVNWARGDFLNFPRPDGLKGFFIFNVLDQVGIAAGDKIVSKALDELRNPGDFLVTSTYLGDPHARGEGEYCRDSKRILDIAASKGMRLRREVRKYNYTDDAEVFTLLK